MGGGVDLGQLRHCPQLGPGRLQGRPGPEAGQGVGRSLTAGVGLTVPTRPVTAPLSTIPAKLAARSHRTGRSSRACPREGGGRMCSSSSGEVIAVTTSEASDGARDVELLRIFGKSDRKLSRSRAENPQPHQPHTPDEGRRFYLALQISALQTGQAAPPGQNPTLRIKCVSPQPEPVQFVARKSHTDINYFAYVVLTIFPVILDTLYTTNFPYLLPPGLSKTKVDVVR